MRKNQAGQKLKVFAFLLADNTPVLGDAANITCELSLDYGANTPTSDVNPTESQDGFYYFDLTAAETNADVIDPFPVSATAGVQVIAVPGTIYPEGDQYTYPLAGVFSSAVETSIIDVFYQSTKTIGPIPIVDGDGNAVNMSAYSGAAVLAIETKDKVPIQSVTGLTFTGSGSNEFYWTPSADAVSKVRQLRMSVRVPGDGNQPYFGAIVNVSYLPVAP